MRNTKQDILDVAWRMIAEQGYAATSLSQICRKVGIAKPTLLHHYASKEKLYLAVLQKVAGDLASLLVEKLPDDPVMALNELALRISRWSRAQPQSMQLIMRDMSDRVMRQQRARVWPLGFFIDVIHDLFTQLRHSHPRDPQITANQPGEPPVFEAFLAMYLGSISYQQLLSPVIGQMLHDETASIDQASTDLLAMINRMLIQVPQGLNHNLTRV